MKPSLPGWIATLLEAADWAIPIGLILLMLIWIFVLPFVGIYCLFRH